MMDPARYPDGSERRAAFELRAASGRRLTGRAAVFNAPTQIGGFREVILPGAFTGTLQTRGDVLALCDHDPQQLLGRTKSGTLILREGSDGLDFELLLPPTALGDEVHALAQRGDLGGMSFAFWPTQETWSADKSQRELRAVDLLEVSVVRAFPAYSGTSVEARMAHASRAAERRRRLLEML